METIESNKIDIIFYLQIMCSQINHNHGMKEAIKVDDDHNMARIMSHKSDCIEYNDDKCFSYGLCLLSNVAVAAINNTNIKKGKDRTSLNINNSSSNNNNNNNNNNKNTKDSISDGWDVFRFQISEEKRTNKVFNSAEEFLYHWLVELKRCKENSRLRPIFINVKKFKWNNKSQTLDVFRAEASARYKQLTYTQKALYRAIAKEYFRKKKSG